MPTLADHQAASTTKMLLIGDSGTGKTGSLVSLAEAGYNLRILDFDNGLDILANKLRGKPAAAHVVYETFTDKFENVGGRPVCKSPKAFQNAMKLMSEWNELGRLETWTAQDVLVIDSFTRMWEAAQRWHLKLNGRDMMEQRDWNHLQTLTRNVLATLYDVSVPCNVVVIAHIDYRYKDIRNDKGVIIGREPEKGYPNAPGKQLSPMVGSYFNSMLHAISRGNKRILTTQTDGIVETKSSNPDRVKREYPIETGLADFFKDVRS